MAKLKISIDSVDIQKRIAGAGYTIEQMARVVERTTQTFKGYLKSEMMPFDIFQKMMAYIRDAESNDNVTRINNKIVELTELGLNISQIMNEVSKSLANVHPNMLDDAYEIVREVRYL